MAEIGQELQLRMGEVVTVRRNAASTGGELLELEAVFGPSPAKPAAHYHPRQDERFEVLEGAMRAHAGGERRVYRAGESYEIPRGTRHTMSSEGEEPARVIWQIRPALDTEAFFEGLDALTRAGRVDAKGMPELAGAGAVLHAHPHVFRLAGVPDVLQRPLFAALAAANRLRRAPRRPEHSATAA